MSKVFRFGILLPEDLIGKFDKLIKGKKYTNRSKALGDLIRQELIKKERLEGKEMARAITLIYGYRKRELLNKITDIQHDFQIVAVKDNPKEVQKLADVLKSVKGMKRGTLSMSSTGKNI